MIKRWLSKYFATVFVLATLMGVFHQHSDMSAHEDCQICIIQSNIADGDTPSEVSYLGSIQTKPQSVVVYTDVFYHYKTTSSLHARAPPKLT